MCSRATCRRCGKATYSGCGDHIEEALRGVPLEQRCACGGAPIQGGSSPTRTAAHGSSGRSVFKRLFGR